MENKMQTSSDSHDSHDVSVILIGLNARKFVVECIHSLVNAQWNSIRYELIYIDNGSSDDSVAAVTDQFNEQVNLIANPTNIGFCPAANQGAEIAKGEYLYFINDDTLVKGAAIALTVDYMREHPNVGTVGSRLIFPDGGEQYSGRMFPNIYSSILGRRSWLTKFLPNIKPVTDYLCSDKLAKNEPFEVDWVSAAGQVVRATDFSKVGGYAEDYYYWHEAVFCHRLKKINKRIVLHPQSVIIHYEGKGSGPRPLKAQRFHIKNFHIGAYRAYCEWHSLPTLSPTKLFVAGSLALRGSALFALAHLRVMFK